MQLVGWGAGEGSRCCGDGWDSEPEGTGPTAKGSGAAADGSDATFDGDGSTAPGEPGNAGLGFDVGTGAGVPMKDS
ncbi:hypothetical protein StoSoilB13_47790 (plasmid) [Arthrobacter sp. StoSoilB13]|nr:hypothetical protein StoSoilB13_47790 [Arthrobacter sp. StoSoilB13]